MYYGWSKEFLEAGKRRLAGDPARAATSGEVKDLRREASALKEVVALTLENRKIERWHQTLKNRILLDNYYLPGDLERQISAFVEHYNHVRYHESIDNRRASRRLLREG
jgi:transposase InsO family protein